MYPGRGLIREIRERICNHLSAAEDLPEGKRDCKKTPGKAFRNQIYEIMERLSGGERIPKIGELILKDKK